MSTRRASKKPSRSKIDPGGGDELAGRALATWVVAPAYAGGLCLRRLVGAWWGCGHGSSGGRTLHQPRGRVGAPSSIGRTAEKLMLTSTSLLIYLPQWARHDPASRGRPEPRSLRKAAHAIEPTPPKGVPALLAAGLLLTAAACGSADSEARAMPRPPHCPAATRCGSGSSTPPPAATSPSAWAWVPAPPPTTSTPSSTASTAARSSWSPVRPTAPPRRRSRAPTSSRRRGRRRARRLQHHLQLGDRHPDHGRHPARRRHPVRLRHRRQVENRVFFSAPQAAFLIGALQAFSEQGKKSVTLVAADIPATHQSVDLMLKPVGEALGMKVEGLYFSPTNPNFNAIASTIKETNPDVGGLMAAPGPVGLHQARAEPAPARLRGHDLHRRVHRVHRAGAGRGRGRRAVLLPLAAAVRRVRAADGSRAARDRGGGASPRGRHRRLLRLRPVRRDRDARQRPQRAHRTPSSTARRSCPRSRGSRSSSPSSGRS